MSIAPAFIGFGEVGYYIAQRLGEEGVKGIRAFDPAADGTGAIAETIRKRMAETDVTPVPSVEELLKDATLVITAVPAKFNEDAAKSALPFMRGDILYVDVTSCSPLVKEKLAKEYAVKGFRHVDSAMLGGPPPERRAGTLPLVGRKKIRVTTSALSGRQSRHCSAS